MIRAGACLLVCIITAWASAAVPPCTDPFDAAAIVPGDVSLYIHVEDAGDLRRELADRPISQWLELLGAQSDLRAAWTSLATSAATEPGALFDSLLGQRCTFIARGVNEWALVTTTSPAKSKTLLQHARAVVREPRAGFLIAELPEQEITIAHDRHVLVAGPAKHRQLLLDVIDRIHPEIEDQRTTSLAGFDAITKSSELGPGRIGFFIRHELPMGGWSVGVINIRGDDLSLKHCAKFEHAPFMHQPTSVEIDGSPATSFEDRSLVAFVQPMDIGDGPVEAFVSATLNEGLISREMRANLGDRRLIVLGEQEGRMQRKPVDALTTTVVVCMEMKDREQAIRQLDKQMMRLTDRLNQLGNGAFLVEMPRRSCLAKNQPREVDLSQAAQWFTGGFPIMKSVSLNWAVAEGPNSAWYVIGSNPRTLQEVAAQLEMGCDTQPRMIGKFDSCGTANGVRIGRHLESWGGEAEAMAEEGQADELKATLAILSSFSSGFHKCRWQLARPSPNEMRLEIQAKLTPRESAAPQ